MIKTALLLPLMLISLPISHANYRNLPCEAPALASSCFRIHGSLNQGNGTPSTRLWHIGTHHVYGIYSNQYGFIHDDETLDNESPKLPANIEKHRTADGHLDYVYADFEVCPLERHIEGHMQAACIQNATHVVAEH
jgi:hypothetical protein